jgi:hypothetical protein
MSILSTIPTFAFQEVNEMYTCGQASISWNYLGDLTSTLTINITNIDVAQPAPLPIPSSTASISPLTNPPRRRQYNGYDSTWLPNTEQTIASDLSPTASPYMWQSVNVTQGWYKLQATLSGSTFPSTEFFVQNGTNFDCLFSGSAGSSPSGSSVISLPSSTASSSSGLPSASPANPSSVADTSGGGSGNNRSSHTGAIVGGVLGGLAFLVALAAAAILFLCRRRRRRGARYARRAQGVAPISAKRARGGTDSMQALPTRAPTSQSLPQSEEDLGVHAGASVSHEKMLVLGTPEDSGRVALTSADEPLSPHSPLSSEDHMHPPLPPVFIPAPTMAMNRSPPAGPGRRASGSSGRSSGSSSEMYSMRERSKSQPDAVPPVGRAPPVPAVPSRRKPVPKYDSRDFASAEREGAAAEQTRPSNDLHHQNSYGSMRAMHVLIPDLPPPPPRE